MAEMGAGALLKRWCFSRMGELNLGIKNSLGALTDTYHCGLSHAKQFMVLQ